MVLGIIGAVFGEDPADSEPEPTAEVAAVPTQEPTVEPTIEPTEPAEDPAPDLGTDTHYFDQYGCTPAPAHVVDEIRAGLIMNVDFENVYMVRSLDHQQVWFVGGMISGGDLDAEPTYAVYGTTMVDADGNMDPAGGDIYSVGGAAHGWSNWPDSDQLSMTETAHAARHCAENN